MRAEGRNAFGGADQEFVIAEGQVRRVHAHASILLAGSERIDMRRWQPLLYAFRHYLDAHGPLARNFRAEP